MPDISVIIVNYNTRHLLEQCVAALEESARPAGIELELVIVDNASRDLPGEFIRTRFPRARFVQNHINVGFGRANNQALGLCTGPYVLLVNTDAFVSADTIPKTFDYMDRHPRCGVLGVRLEGRDGILQPSCRYFPTPLNIFLLRTGLNRHFPSVQAVDDMAWDHASVRACDWVPGCYYLCRRSVLDEVGLFDSRYFLYYEEVDHCAAVKSAGFEVTFFPFTTVIHIGGESAKSDGDITSVGRQLSSLQTESELLYFRKHRGVAGVALHLLLSTLCDALLALKALVVRRRVAMGIAHLKQISLQWRLLARTRFANVPTR